jgi:hypothetical protein
MLKIINGKVRKVYFDSVSEVSVHGCLALLLWAWSSTVHHNESIWQRRSVHVKVARKQREKEKRVGSSIFFKGLPQ